MSTAAQPITQIWDPIAALREKYPGIADESDARVAGYLAKPENFRKSFPEYAHLDDETIRRNMATIGRQIGERAGKVEQPEGSPAGRFATAAGSTLGGFVTGPLKILRHGFAPEVEPTPAYDIAQATEEGKKRIEEGRGLPYRATAEVGALLGVNPAGMEEASRRGDIAGILGQAGATGAVAATGLKEVRDPLLKAGKATLETGKRMAEVAAHPSELFRKPEVAQSLIKEAAKLPPLAVTGTEDIFRAAAPTGKKGGFRANSYAAAGDLAEIAQTLDLKSARGGITNPDMRARATVKALDEHLSKMYNEERAPQIQRNAEAQVSTKLSNDAKDALSYLADSAGKEADRTLANNVSKMQSMSLVEADQLARIVNEELAPLRKMTAQERAAANVTNRKIASLKALDQELKVKLNEELQNRGEVGLTEYERRYAALSEIRNQLRDRTNAVELQRDLPAARKIRAVLTGKTGIASASQAAVADANIGKLLESGFDRLKRSGLKPDRGTPSIAPQVKGLLPSGAIPMPSRSAPIEPMAAHQVPEMGTRAERLGLLLPSKGQTSPPRVVIKGALPPAPKITPQRGYSAHQTTNLLDVMEARPTWGRDPKTGRFKKVYTTEGKD